MDEQYYNGLPMPFFTPLGFQEDESTTQYYNGNPAMRKKIRYTPPSDMDMSMLGTEPPINPLQQLSKPSQWTKLKTPNQASSPFSMQNVGGMVANLGSSLGAGTGLGTAISSGGVSGALGALGVTPVGAAMAGAGAYMKLFQHANDRVEDEHAPTFYNKQYNKFNTGGPIEQLNMQMLDALAADPGYRTGEINGPWMNPPVKNFPSIDSTNLPREVQSQQELFTVIPKTPDAANFNKANFKDKEHRVIQYFKDKGFPSHVAIGIAANLKYESNYDVNVVGDNGKAKGLMQWHPDRRAKLSNFDLTSFQGNLDAAYYELTKGQEKNNFKKVLKSKSSDEAAYAFDTYVERSDHKTRSARAAYASQLDKLYLNY